MSMILVRTQAELNAALANDANARVEIDASVCLEVHLRGTVTPLLRTLGATILRLIAGESSAPHVEAWGSSQPHVVARESSQPHVVARESSQPHVEAWGSSQPHVEAWGSSQPHVEAWESSQPHVVARESSQPHVEAWGSSQPRVDARAFAQLSLDGAGIIAKATAKVAVLLNRGAKATGGKQTRISVRTAKDWCEYYGVQVTDGVAILYKALNDDWRSPHGTSYAPGEIPFAADWDGGRAECGQGLHFSPSPAMAMEFHTTAKRFAGCPVRVADIVVHPNGYYPQKVKAKGCCGPCFAVDRNGVPLEPASAAIADAVTTAKPTKKGTTKGSKSRGRRAVA